MPPGKAYLKKTKLYVDTSWPYPASKPTSKPAGKPTAKLNIKPAVKLSIHLPDPPSVGPFDPPAYSPYKDPTLSSSERAVAAFKPSALLSRRKDFRVRSTLLPEGYTSGKHEVIPTNLFYLLRDAKDNKDGTHTMNGNVVNSLSREIVLKLADGFRTDTAQTILSGPAGKVAGHTNSEVDRAAQPEAHDLLRKKILDILKQDPTTKGMSEASVSNLFGAMAVISMAPGELARKIDRGTASLKAGDQAKLAWESNRNEAKARVLAGFHKLGPDERKFVTAHAQDFLNSTLADVSNPSRILSYQEPTSPFRDPATDKIGEVAGKEYTKVQLPPSLAPPSQEFFGLYATQPFRGNQED